MYLFFSHSGGSLRSHSMNNLLDPTDTYTDQSESKSFGDVPPPATPNRRASVDCRAISPLPEKKLEPDVETKKNYNEHPPPPPPPPPPPSQSQSLRRGSADFQPISLLPDRKDKSASDVQVPENLLSEDDKVIYLFCSVQSYSGTLIILLFIWWFTSTILF